MWELEDGDKDDGVTVGYFYQYPRDTTNRFAFQVSIREDEPPRKAWRIWKLIPMKVEGSFARSQLSAETLGSGSLPSYDGETSQSSARAEQVQSERDEFGTVVTEVTVVTTRKRYRVEDAEGLPSISCV